MISFVIPTSGYSFGINPAQINIRPRITVARIQDVVARYYSIPMREMVSARRGRDVARPRQVAMYLARNMTPKSTPTIGKCFGGRDHTTVLHAVKTVDRLRAIDAEFDDDVSYLERRLAAA